MSAVAATKEKQVDPTKAVLDKISSFEKSLADLSEKSSQATKLFAQAKDADLEKNRGFKTPREFIQKVMEAGQGKSLDNRLKALLVKTAGSDEQMVSSDPYGGFLVPPGFSPELLSVEPEEDPIGGRTRKIPMASPTIHIAARTDKNHTSSVSGGLRVYRREETNDGTTSRMQMERIALETHSLFGACYATEELLTDSPISFAAIISAGFGDEFKAHLVKERLYGTGVGEFMGIMNSGALVSISKETGQAATTLVYENILKMRARCWHYSDAIWLANHDCLPELMRMSLAVGTGGSIVWQPSAVEDRPDMLLGRPIYFSEFCKTLGTTGDIMLVNWNEYLEGVYQPMQSDESIHVRFLNHERAFKFWVRNAGQPWWRSALTVNQGSNSLSPYVALATRS